MPAIVDQMGRLVNVERPPQRIVSTVPSQTELLFDLGLGNRLVGRTRFCVHPAALVKAIANIGGTKKLNLQLIDELRPDLVIANKEENEKHDIDYLASKYPVYLSDVGDLDSALSMITQVGELTYSQNRANKLVADISTAFNEIPKFEGSAAYFIWYNPYMVVGHSNYIHNIISLLGFENAFRTQPRYPEVSIADLEELNPDYLLFSSEPFPFGQKHLDEMKEHLPNTQAVLVDGEMFSWYGSRMLKAADYFKQLYTELSR